MRKKANNKVVINAFGGFNYHKYSVPVILITIVTLFFCAYLFTFERPMWLVTMTTFVFGVIYITGLEGTPESRQINGYLNYLDHHSFKDLHRALKSRSLDPVSKSYIKSHMDDKYPDWDNAPKKQKSQSAKKEVPINQQPKRREVSSRGKSAGMRPENLMLEAA